MPKGLMTREIKHQGRLTTLTSSIAYKPRFQEDTVSIDILHAKR